MLHLCNRLQVTGNGFNRSGARHFLYSLALLARRLCRHKTENVKYKSSARVSAVSCGREYTGTVTSKV